MRPHLFTALLLSLLVHCLFLVGGGLWRPKPPRPPLLNVELRPPDPIEPSEPLLKNTLETPEPQKEPPRPPTKPDAVAPQSSAGPAHPQSSSVKAAPLEAAQRKLSKHLYYPPEAVAAGLEGEVRLLLTLDGNGRIVDADIAASSGHKVLDQAALRAAWAMGSLEGEDKREMILPVLFRLR
ncbi:MAG: energy transducer TonB [Rhodocyclaceae bacterium]|nr:MAG: energy transducer TonB [Rhodocyclaceae bacterium]